MHVSSTHHVNELRQSETEFHRQLVRVVPDGSYQFIVAALTQQIVVQPFGVGVSDTQRHNGAAYDARAQQHVRRSIIVRRPIIAHARTAKRDTSMRRNDFRVGTSTCTAALLVISVGSVIIHVTMLLASIFVNHNSL